MIKHIVMIKLKDASDKSIKAGELKRMLVDLVDKVDELAEMEVGINFNEKSEYDMVLVSGFETKEDLENYRSHPEHVKVLDYLKKVMEKTAVVDYEI